MTRTNYPDRETWLEAAFEAIAKATTDELVAAKCRALMVGYHQRWMNEPWQTESVEETFRMPLRNPKTGAKSKTYELAGKFDGTVTNTDSGNVYLLEHKTCSEDITDPGSPYWRRMPIDSQVSLYMLALWLLGRKVSGTLYDVVRKPSIRPRKVTIKEQKVLAAHGTYFDRPVSRECRLLAEENTELYETRLTADVLENPTKYFGRRTIQRMDNELMTYAGELWDVAKTMLDARKENRNYRNDGACMNWGSACIYLDVCNSSDSIDADRWERVDQRHPELDLDDNGLNVITNSRAKCFQTCRQKHYLQYELGARRVDAEEKEALYFGTVWHKAMDAWWGAIPAIKEKETA